MEQRFVALYDQLQGIDPEWVGLKRLVFVRRSGHRPDKGDYREEHYFILSKAFNDAALVATGIRAHWFIENKLHYVKDVHFKEDKNRIKQGNPASILSLFQDIAINLFRCKGYQSIKKATILHANKIKELWTMLNASHISYL